MMVARFWRMVIAVVLALAMPAAAAQAPQVQRSIAQYNLRSWQLVDGAPPDIWALAQSSDGFLWLGTGAGLYRFDGITFESIAPRIGRLPSRNVTALLAAPDNSLWIGQYSGQVSRLRDGRIDSFGSDDGVVEQLARSQDGTIWVARSGVRGGLFRIDGRGGWARVGTADGIADALSYSVLVARDGAVWVATERHILVRRPGARRFAIVSNSDGEARLAQAPDGQVWASGSRRALAAAGTAGPLAITPLPPGMRQAVADRMIFARDGTLWQSMFGGGVLQVRGISAQARRTAQFDRLTTAQGLPSPVAVPVLQDREDNIWIGTNLGLMRLRPVSAVTALRLSSKARNGFELAVGADGSVYAANGPILYRAAPHQPLRQIAVLPELVTVIAADGPDMILGQPHGTFRLRGDRLMPMALPATPGWVESWTSAADGPLISARGHGVFQLRGGKWQPLGAAATGDAVQAPSGTLGTEWLYAGERLLRRTRRGIGPAVAGATPDIGPIAIVSQGPAGLLIGGERGLARWRGDRFQRIDPAASPELSGITGIVQPADGSVWINGVHGLIATSSAALDEAFAKPGVRLRHQLFTATDGLPGVAQQEPHNSTVVRGGDGRIWVADNVGIGSLDPARLAQNRLPPPVVIRSVSGGDRRFAAAGAVQLPAGTTNLRIVYTALSLAESERVRFRYRLSGVDAGWVEAGTAREAYYANLGPGTWHFQVIAANNDGVWNQHGASVTVTIAPLFYESWWFRLLVVLAGAGTLSMLYVWRMREHLARSRARAEAQIGERARIARELHDTLLQSVQGLMLRFQAAAYATEPGSHANALIEAALDRGDDVLVEARDRVRALRSIDRAGDLLPHLVEIAQRFGEQGLAVTVTREGPPRVLQPDVIEQLLAIVQEALSNVQRHAGTGDARVLLRNRRRQLLLEIADQGVGLPPDVMASGSRIGHYGLAGMRERAAALSGRLALLPGAEGGTIVRVTLPC